MHALPSHVRTPSKELPYDYAQHVSAYWCKCIDKTCPAEIKGLPDSLRVSEPGFAYYKQRCVVLDATDDRCMIGSAPHPCMSQNRSLYPSCTCRHCSTAATQHRTACRSRRCFHPVPRRIQSQLHMHARFPFAQTRRHGTLHLVQKGPDQSPENMAPGQNLLASLHVASYGVRNCELSQVLRNRLSWCGTRLTWCVTHFFASATTHSHQLQGQLCAFATKQRETYCRGRCRRCHRSCRRCSHLEPGRYHSHWGPLQIHMAA